MPLDIIFMGTPDFAVPTLAALIGSRHRVVAVYCQPPRPAGRGMALRPTPVQAMAESRGLAVHTPLTLRAPETRSAFTALGADVAVVAAYGLLLPPPILAGTRHGCLNLHPSKLPRWRGAAPIQRTIMAGDSETEFCIMRMEAGLDTGPVCLSEPFAIPATMTAGELHDIAATRGAELMLRALDRLEAGTLDCTPQAAEGVTYAAKIDKAEARIDWRRPAGEVCNLIRGLSPFPGAWCEVAGERMKILRAELTHGSAEPGTLLDDTLTIACGEGGAVRLLDLQRAGKKPVSAAELLRGLAIPAGTRLA